MSKGVMASMVRNGESYNVSLPADVGDEHNTSISNSKPGPPTSPTSASKPYTTSRTKLMIMRTSFTDEAIE